MFRFHRKPVQHGPRRARRARTGSGLGWAISGFLVGSIAAGWAAMAQSAAGAVPNQASQAQVATSRHPATATILVTVMDENSVAVASARVQFALPSRQVAISGETDFAGRWQAAGLAVGTYNLQVEKEGFYAVTKQGIQVGETRVVDVTLNHEKEYTQSVKVVYSPPAINPSQTNSSVRLNSANIVNIPYPVTRDIRYALPLLPGIVQDGTGQVHVDGAATQQTQDVLDGFNISDPASGLFDLRVNVDALRSVDVQTSRYPAEFGKGSGGILSLTTGMGDDHLRYSATDFLPGLQNRHGLHINKWQPRFTFSGPLGKGKAWFLLAPEGEYDVSVVQELPPGSDRTTAWRFGNLAKFQWNFKENHILSGSYLFNTESTRNYGLTRFNPIETTANLRNSAHFASLKDQALLSDGGLLELGVAVTRFHSRERPKGDQTYQETPDGTRGNFYATSEGRSSRTEAIANLFVPPLNGHGKHEVKIGLDVDRLTFDGSVLRQPFEVLRENGTLADQVSFSGQRSFGKSNVEASAYAEDRWSLTDRAITSVGVRTDRDEVVHRVLVSPRWAASYLLTRRRETKLAAGIGIYYDASNLDFISRPFEGERLDAFHGATGQFLVAAPVETSFKGAGPIREPRFVNWSASLEHMFPHETFFQIEYTEKRGHDGWTYARSLSSPVTGLGGDYVFQNTRKDRFDAVELTLKHTWSGGHVVMVSYERSRARSNEVLDFNLDDPLFSPQVPGPLPWDSPNRVVSWGFLPLPVWKPLNFGYSLDWHSGFPFGLINQDQELVAPPGARRFPDYFSLNLAVERRFWIFGFLTDLRAGFDDVTNRHNSTAVDNNVDSPHFLTFAGLQGRALVARLRILGRK